MSAIGSKEDIAATLLPVRPEGSPALPELPGALIAVLQEILQKFCEASLPSARRARLRCSCHSGWPYLQKFTANLRVVSPRQSSKFWRAGWPSRPLVICWKMTHKFASRLGAGRLARSNFQSRTNFVSDSEGVSYSCIFHSRI